MKTLIILKGLVKKDKLDWVKRQGLELFFLDYSAVRNLYSAPELLTPDKTVLNFSYSDIVHKRFLEVLCFRMSKGCLIVLDIENLTGNTIETLAEIFGYKVFWVVNKIPRDYLKNTIAYQNPMFPMKSKLEYKKDILNYNNSTEKIDPSERVLNYAQVEKYWLKENRKNNITKVSPNHGNILHVSDLHSHYEILKEIEPRIKDSDLSIVYGDYVDGPIQGGSRKILDYILKCNDPKVIWLEGNHESRLRKYLGYKLFKDQGKSTLADILYNGLPNDFLEKTAPEFSDLGPEGGLDYIRELNKKLQLFHIISIPEDKMNFICTHSGFRYIDQISPKFIGNVVYGSRNIDKIDRTFSDKVGKKTGEWSIHAHCKYPEWNVNKYPKVMNIDPLDDKEVVLMTQTKENWKICKLRHDE